MMLMLKKEEKNTSGKREENQRNAKKQKETKEKQSQKNSKEYQLDYIGENDVFECPKTKVFIKIC